MTVYLIRNKVTGMCYVGQTIGSLENRWTRHASKSSCCRYLKHAIAKYGRESFEISVVATANDIDELNVLEERYIQELNTLSPHGYNLNAGGNNRRASAETRARMSKAQKGSSHPGQRGVNPWKNRKRGPISKEHATALTGAAHKFNLKPIKCIQTQKVYGSTKEAVAHLGLSQGNVSQILQGKRKQTRGYSFEYVNREDAQRSLKKKSS